MPRSVLKGLPSLQNALAAANWRGSNSRPCLVDRKTGLRPTMTDIARLAGVSQSCVSLVLNDAPGGRLSDATKLRVREIAQQHGYRLPKRRPRRSAIEEAGRTVIAYVVDEVSISPHAILNVDGARDAAWTQEWTVQVYVTRGDAALEAATFRSICSNPAVAGVIHARSFTCELAPPTGLGSLPTILLNCYTPQLEYTTLLPGEIAGGFAATQHLLDLGHRRIGMIGGEPWMDASRDRQRGYREALATADIGCDPALVRDGDWSAGSGYRQTMDLMRQRRSPTALFCASDMMAVGAIDALGELGYNVPGDVSVVGYNDIELAQHRRPPLTSCRVPSYEMGQRAAEMLMAHALSSKPLRPSLTKLECRMVVRASTAVRRVLAKSGLA